MKKNTKLAIFACLSVFVVFTATSILFFGTVNDQGKTLSEDDYVTETDVVRKAPPRPLDAMYGQSVDSVNTARTLSLLDVKSPLTIPAELELKSVNVRVEPDNQLNMVTQIYVPKDVNFDAITTFEDVMNESGIIVVQTKEAPNFDSNMWIDEYVKQTPNAHQITVNGKKAVGFEGDVKTGKRSQVIFYEGDIQVILVSAGQSKATLIQMAESLR